jgi:hypothetical protein
VSCSFASLVLCRCGPAAAIPLAPSDALPEALAYNLNFFHPLLMLGLLALSSYGMVLGIKAKKTRTADAETRKQ